MTPVFPFSRFLVFSMDEVIIFSKEVESEKTEVIIKYKNLNAKKEVIISMIEIANSDII